MYTISTTPNHVIFRKSYQGEIYSCDVACESHDVVWLLSDGTGIFAYEPDIVHDIVDSEEECYDDEDDSNGKHVL